MAMIQDEKEFQWEQFRELIEMHKFYFENIIKSGIIILSIIGAVSSYVIGSNIRNRQELIFAFCVPILMSLGGIIISSVGTFKVLDLSKQVNKLQASIGVSWKPHSEILPLLTLLFSALFLLSILGMGFAIMHPELMPNKNKPDACLAEPLGQ